MKGQSGIPLTILRTLGLTAGLRDPPRGVDKGLLTAPRGVEVLDEVSVLGSPTEVLRLRDLVSGDISG